MRIAVFGASGSGKTTLAAALGAAFGIPVTHLDDVFHQPGWKELEAERFRAEVTPLVAADAWVIDGNYSRVRDLVLGRADTVIILKLPMWISVVRLIYRTFGRHFGWKRVTPLPKNVQADGEPVFKAIWELSRYVRRWKQERRAEGIRHEARAAGISDTRIFLIRRPQEADTIITRLKALKEQHA